MLATLWCDLGVWTPNADVFSVWTPNAGVLGVRAPRGGVLGVRATRAGVLSVRTANLPLADRPPYKPCRGRREQGSNASRPYLSTSTSHASNKTLCKNDAHTAGCTPQAAHRRLHTARANLSGFRGDIRTRARVRARAYVRACGRGRTNAYRYLRKKTIFINLLPHDNYTSLPTTLLRCFILYEAAK